MKTPEPLPITRSPRKDIPFIFKCYRQLIKDLGAMDGLAAALTIGSQRFLDDAQRQADPQAFGVQWAEIYGVPSKFIDYPKVKPHLNQLLIVGTHQQAEAFLEDFVSEQKIIGRNWRNRKDGETLIKYVLDCLPNGFNHNFVRIWKERYELLEYYRTIRNGFVHLDVSREKLQKEFIRISGLRAYVKENFNLDAPNSFDKMEFDDHFLYTRIVKYTATDLCRLGAPDRTEELIRVIEHCARNDIGVLRKFMSRRDPEREVRRVLRSWFRFNFNFDIEANEQIETGVVEWLLKIPNKKTRRSVGDETLRDILNL